MTTTCTHCAAGATNSCVTCHAELCAEHTRMGHPLITVRQLLSTALTMALRAPALLGEMLFKELDQVAYCADCREVVVGRRESEQLKMAGGLLLLMLLVVAVPVVVMMS